MSFLLSRLQAEASCNRERRNDIQNRGMSGDDIRLFGFPDPTEPPLCRSNFEQFAHDWRGRRHGGRSMEQESVDSLKCGGTPMLSWRRKMDRLPAASALTADASPRACDVAALQGQRVVKDMQDTHRPPGSIHNRQPLR